MRERALFPKRARTWFVARGLALVLASVLGLAQPSFAAGEMALEYKVKAAFIFHFVSLVTWPEAAFEDKGTPYRVCVWGADPFGATLDRALADQTIKGRRIALRRASDEAALARCHVVFVRTPSAGAIAQELGRLRAAGALLVGESDDFLGRGGMVQFRLVDGRVRFALNLDAVGAAGLKVSSRMVQSAVKVVEQP